MKTTLAWFLGALLFAAASLVAAPARADAAADVRDLRAGKLPVRHEMLGWTAAGDALFRTLVCAEGGTTACTAALVVVTPDGDVKTTVLLDVTELYCGDGVPCEALSPKVAKDFVEKERVVMSVLPPLVRGRSVDAAGAFGTVAGTETEVVVRVRDGGERFEMPGVRTELALSGGKGAAVRLDLLSEWDPRIEGTELQSAYLSPDGRRVVIVTALGAGEMCWGPFWELAFSSVETAPAAAALADLIGARRLKKGDLAGARAALEESTALDPSVAATWLRRASIESRLGATDDALASLERAAALDYSVAVRACKDAAFGRLLRGAAAATPVSCS